MSDVSIVDEIWSAKTRWEYHRRRVESVATWACVPYAAYAICVFSYLFTEATIVFTTAVVVAGIAIVMLIAALFQAYKAHTYSEQLSVAVQKGSYMLTPFRRKRWLSKDSEDLYDNLMDELLCQECHIGNECPLCDTTKQ